MKTLTNIIRSTIIATSLLLVSCNTQTSYIGDYALVDLDQDGVSDTLRTTGVDWGTGEHSFPAKGEADAVKYGDINCDGYFDAFYWYEDESIFKVRPTEMTENDANAPKSSSSLIQTKDFPIYCNKTLFDLNNDGIPDTLNTDNRELTVKYPAIDLYDIDRERKVSGVKRFYLEDMNCDGIPDLVTQDHLGERSIYFSPAFVPASYSMFTDKRRDALVALYKDKNNISLLSPQACEWVDYFKD